jgi:uncharacterized protein YacL
MAEVYELYDEEKQAYVFVNANETITVSASKRNKASRLFQTAWYATKTAPRSTRRWLNSKSDVILNTFAAIIAIMIAVITAAIFFGALPLALIFNFGFAWYTAIMVGMAMQYLIIKAVKAISIAGEMAVNTYKTQKLMRQMMQFA